MSNRTLAVVLFVVSVVILVQSVLIYTTGGY